MTSLISHLRGTLHGLDGGVVGGWIMLADLLLFGLLVSNWERAGQVALLPLRNRSRHKR